jgi:carbonic anhydrase
MKNSKLISTVFVALLFSASYIQAHEHPDNSASKKSNAPAKHADIKTPADALAELKNGNQRFLDGKQININYKEEIVATKDDQHPHSIILSCVDSRVPPEIIFDQGIGNIFVARVAGNIEDPNMVGSMEFATKVKGTKLIVVMGHSKCGAVKGAIDNADLGNLTQLIDQIKPAITGDKSNMDLMLTESAKKNVELTIADILNQSPVISDLVKQGKVKIVGAYYDISDGKVSFMD